MIERIYIQNYRSIKTIDIHPKNLSGLIGPNSTGKTNILKALNILLGETYPTERAFSKDDFYNRDTSQPIIIKIQFRNSLSPVRLTKLNSSTKGDCACKKITLKFEINETGSSTSFFCENDVGEKFYANGAVRDQVAFVYIPSERNFEKQLSISKWTLFGKILSRIDTHFKLSEKRVEGFKESMEVPRSILEQDYDEGLSFAQFKQTFIHKTIENTKGHTNGCAVNLEIYDPLWYFKMIHITTEEQDNKIFNAEEVGSGTQNLILLSLFQTFAELLKSNAILAIEEPELYLFPHAQRRLYKEFRKLSENSQIFYTTHSPNFVDINNCNDAIILRKCDGHTKQMTKPNLEDFLNADAKHQLHLLTKFNTEVNEIFFADKIILVEGDTEKYVLPHIIEKMIGDECVTINHLILNCHSKDSIPFFIKVLDFLGIDSYLAIFDNDLHPHKNENQIAIARKSTEKILACVDGDTSKILQLENDFESCCGYTITSDTHKIRDAVTWASTLTSDNIPSVFNQLKEFLES